jgi:hypothetical protein
VSPAVTPCSACGASASTSAPDTRARIDSGDGAICRPCLGALGALVSKLGEDRVSALWRRRPRKAAAPSPRTPPAESERMLAELKRGVDREVAPDDAHTRLELAMAYDAMGLMHDAVREAAIAFGESAPEAIARQALGWLFAPERCTKGTLGSLLATLRRRGRA